MHTRTAARVVFVVVGLSPWLLTLARAWRLLGEDAGPLDSVFSAICHRLPERTLRLAGVVMPLCSRCAGIFAGLAAAALVGWPADARPRARRGWLLSAGLCMVVDVIARAAGPYPGGHATRLATGFAFGYALAVGLLPPRAAPTSSLDA
ncbi:DUF2085 domain-containing protein [Polyangium sp. y55x31]|uniref:DUF2085 domain-containing protein n=1 Tax=Polyangium sp. y55x31 TaxID=3042688 RepID=UPI002483180B|nr:DUF2085 domain-containing protein [Polyangium sp. y55x31]MDI1478525.1 DUF2085 domain-containing protein [Polyangium sp. y55x31]